MSKKEVKPGIYRHFKGEFYEVIGVARDCEDPSQEIVFYKGLYDHPEFGKDALWARTKSDFLEDKVSEDGAKITRFEFIRH
jgi:hypothetical protein